MLKTIHILVAGLPALLAAGQGVLPGETDDDIDRQIEDAERLVPRSPGEIEAFSPRQAVRTSPVRPGLTGGANWATMLEPAWPGTLDASLLPERSFVNSLRGTVLRGPRDTRIFVPSPDSGTSTHPRAMLLLPCITLERFNSYALADDARVPSLLTGQVFLYNNRNYVLPTSIHRSEGGVTAASAPVAGGRADGESLAHQPEKVDSPSFKYPAGDRPDPLADNPDVFALMDELERHSPIARPPTRSQSSVSGAGAASVPVRISDGDYIAARRGRVIRMPEGTWSFVPDSDEPGLGRALGYILLPCRTLEALERRVLYHGDAVAGLMSGRVYRFGGHDYLLPTLYQIEHRDGIDPLQ